MRRDLWRARCGASFVFPLLRSALLPEDGTSAALATLSLWRSYTNRRIGLGFTFLCWPSLLVLWGLLHFITFCGALVFTCDGSCPLSDCWEGGCLGRDSSLPIRRERRPAARRGGIDTHKITPPLHAFAASRVRRDRTARADPLALAHS